MEAAEYSGMHTCFPTQQPWVWIKALKFFYVKISDVTVLIDSVLFSVGGQSKA